MADASSSSGLWEQQRQHYNQHVRSDLSTREALQLRSQGPAQELKDFHNHVKRQLIMRFAYKQDRLLDLCCGRGGDIHKWKEAQVSYVRGLDISDREVEEARRRYQELLRRGNRGHVLACEFVAVDWLGEQPYDDPAGSSSYGVVSCMFALHYFFVSEASLRTFLRNVASNLRQGGYFLGTLPSVQRVLKLLNGQPEFRSPMLKLQRRWKETYPGHHPLFGAGYICDIADTVTASVEGATEGSLEYMVDLPTLQRMAAEVGLHPVKNYHDPVLASCFKEEDVDAPFKHFKPFFLHSLQLDAQEGRPLPQPPSSLEKASSLFAAFVFQKVEHPNLVTLPIAPECTYMPDRTQARGGGGGGRVVPPPCPDGPYGRGGAPPPHHAHGRDHPHMGHAKREWVGNMPYQPGRDSHEKRPRYDRGPGPERG